MDDRDEIFECIYDEHFEYVWHTLRHLGVPERDISDVCQRVFLIVYQKLDAYDSERPVRPWLAGFANRVAANYRKKGIHSREFLDDPEPPSEPAKAVDNLAGDEAKQVVREALARVDTEKRVIFILNKIDGHPVPDIAEGESIPLNTAYSRLRVAKEQFSKAVRAITNRTT